MQPKKGINQGMMALCVYGDRKIIDFKNWFQQKHQMEYCIKVSPVKLHDFWLKVGQSYKREGICVYSNFLDYSTPVVILAEMGEL